MRVIVIHPPPDPLDAAIERVARGNAGHPARSPVERAAEALAIKLFVAERAAQFEDAIAAHGGDARAALATAAREAGVDVDGAELVMLPPAPPAPPVGQA